MKTTFALGVALVVLAPVQAQTLRPEIVTGTLLGGAAGAIIGHNSGDLHHNGWRGAAIGAGAGLLLGSMAAQANDRTYSTQVPVPDAPRTYVYREAPAYYQETAFTTGGSERSDYRTNGLLLGALAGGIIGHNSGDLRHNGWRGAAIGAGLGYLLGSVAEHNARQREALEARAVAAQPAPVYSARAASESDAAVVTAPAAAPSTASSMSAANSLFGRK